MYSRHERSHAFERRERRRKVRVSGGPAGRLRGTTLLIRPWRTPGTEAAPPKHALGRLRARGGRRSGGVRARSGSHQLGGAARVAESAAADALDQLWRLLRLGSALPPPSESDRPAGTPGSRVGGGAARRGDSRSVGLALTLSLCAGSLDRRAGRGDGDGSGAPAEPALRAGGRHERRADGGAESLRGRPEGHSGPDGAGREQLGLGVGQGQGLPDGRGRAEGAQLRRHGMHAWRSCRQGARAHLGNGRHRRNRGDDSADPAGQAFLPGRAVPAGGWLGAPDRVAIRVPSGRRGHLGVPAAVPRVAGVREVLQAAGEPREGVGGGEAGGELWEVVPAARHLRGVEGGRSRPIFPGRRPRHEADLESHAQELLEPGRLRGGGPADFRSGEQAGGRGRGQNTQAPEGSSRREARPDSITVTTRWRQTATFRPRVPSRGCVEDTCWHIAMTKTCKMRSLEQIASEFSLLEEWEEASNMCERLVLRS
eukprot:scaffold3928_cov257-Pinguiococcus_pyrenoidosus.AAC.9